MNKYDLEHACTAHPLMSKEAWDAVYHDAWRRYYSAEHVETVMRRAIASGVPKNKVLDVLIIFSSAVRIEGVHPLQFGYARRKVRTQRRPGMKIVNPLVFYPWRAYDFCRSAVQWVSVLRRYKAMMRRIAAEPGAESYMDEALRPPAQGGELDHFVQVYADKIPKTHGAPTREPVAAPAVAAE